MTDTRIRDTLHDVADAAPVPHLDRVGFERRLRDARRRRTTVRGVVAAAAASVLVAGAAGGVRLAGELRDTAPPPASETGGAAKATPVQTVPVIVDGRLLVLTPDGAEHRSDVRAEEVLAMTPYGALVANERSEVLLVPVGRDGRPGEPETVLPALSDGVTVSPDGEEIAYLAPRHEVRIIRVADRSPVTTIGPVDMRERIVGVDGDTVLTMLGNSALRLRGPDGVRTLRPPAGQAPQDASLAGSVVRSASATTVTTFDADGHQLATGIAGTVSGLSTDGRWVAAASDGAEGGRRGITVYDAATGRPQRMAGYAGGESIDVISWLDHDRFLAGGLRGGGSFLLDCSVAQGACTERYADPDDTIYSPTR